MAPAPAKKGGSGSTTRTQFLFYYVYSKKLKVKTELNLSSFVVPFMKNAWEICWNFFFPLVLGPDPNGT